MKTFTVLRIIIPDRLLGVMCLPAVAWSHYQHREALLFRASSICLDPSEITMCLRQLIGICFVAATTLICGCEQWWKKQ